ncbi:MAG: uracil-DNA glycosylase [Planctomycetota bacterium]|jgi:uracil-DNA glycosylase
MTWQELLTSERELAYYKELLVYVQQERGLGKKIFPPTRDVFNVFSITPLEDTRVVILGQDPYHGVGQAQGLCFSVQKGVRIPPSLRNIHKELSSDLGIQIPDHGSLESWAKNGVFLLNAVLTVEASKPASHAGKGWEQFTDTVIKKISDQKDHVVFLLWGKYAQEKEKLIDMGKHTVLIAPHPSPFSAYKGFFGCKHFSQANASLEQHGQEVIDWRIGG